MKVNVTSIEYPEEFSQIVPWFYIFVIFCSILGNSVVIIVILRKHHKTSNFRWLLVHLAICEIIFAIILFADIPKWIYKQWIYRDAFCKIIPSFQLTASLAAESTVIVIVLERYNAISQPLEYRWAPRNLVIPLLLVWIFSIASVSPYFMVHQVVEQNGRQCCVEVWNEDENQASRSQIVYTAYLLLSTFFTPLALIAVLYRRIIYTTHKTKSLVPNNFETVQKRRKKEMRIIKLLVALVFAFVLCIIPRHIGHLILSMLEFKKTVKLAIQYVMAIPYPMQCMINPFIYTAIDKQFRRDVKSLFLCQLQTRRTYKTDPLFYDKKISVSLASLSEAGQNI